MVVKTLWISIIKLINTSKSITLAQRDGSNWVKRQEVNNGMRAIKVLFKCCAFTSIHIVLFLASRSEKDFRVLQINKLASLLKDVLLHFNFCVLALRGCSSLAGLASWGDFLGFLRGTDGRESQRWKLTGGHVRKPGSFWPNPQRAPHPSVFSALGMVEAWACWALLLWMAGTHIVIIYHAYINQTVIIILTALEHIQYVWPVFAYCSSASSCK